MLNRLAAICNFRLGNLKLDHCQKEQGWGGWGWAQSCWNTHTVQPCCRPGVALWLAD